MNNLSTDIIELNYKKPEIYLVGKKVKVVGQSFPRGLRKYIGQVGVLRNREKSLMGGMWNNVYFSDGYVVRFLDNEITRLN